MAYTIYYLDAKGLIGRDVCTGPLVQAQRIAVKALADNMADAVEVRDRDDVLVYRRSKSHK